MIAPTIQYAICVAKQVTWLVIVLTQVFPPTMQGCATTAISRATLPLTARMRRLATTAAKLVTLHAIARMILSATFAAYQAMSHANVPNLALRKYQEVLSET